MKQTNLNPKSKFLNRAVSFTVLLLAVSLFIGCPNGSSVVAILEGEGVTPAVKNHTYTVDGVEFKMISIAAKTDASLGDDERADNKTHIISLSAYYIGETEVTQKLWHTVMVNNPSNFNKNDITQGERQDWRPVEYVTWYQAIAFCNELTKKVNGLGEAECVYYSDEDFNMVYTKEDADSEKTPYQKMSKKGFRLPTEAEWEWAAKGGTDYKWPGTSSDYFFINYAWYNLNSSQKTHEVKLKKPNDYGLYDMSGNVWEWCWDCYEHINITGKKFPQDYSGPSLNNNKRVKRGGGYEDDALQCIIVLRSYDMPDHKFRNIGFRLVCRP